jgi:formiminoglutamase
MNQLPLLLSVPHAGLHVPPEVKGLCILTEQEIIEDGDEGAAEIYWPLEERVAAFLTTDIARAVIDLNRTEGDFRKDGIIKTHTCWDVPVYSEYPSQEIINTLIKRYHRPYHNQLIELAKSDVLLAIDCHTMAAVGPPVGPDTGKPRPAVCLGDTDGSLPREWRDFMMECFTNAFAPHKVTLNDPFNGGYITQTHAAEMPWVQLELSRGPFMSNKQKTECVLTALRAWCDKFV